MFLKNIIIKKLFKIELQNKNMLIKKNYNKII